MITISACILLSAVYSNPQAQMSVVLKCDPNYTIAHRQTLPLAKHPPELPATAAPQAVAVAATAAPVAVVQAKPKKRAMVRHAKPRKAKAKRAGKPLARQANKQKRPRPARRDRVFHIKKKPWEFWK